MILDSCIHCEVIRSVSVYRNSYIWIVRNIDSFEELCFSACTVAGEHQETSFSVRTVTASDEVYEIVLELVDNITLGNCFCSPPLVRLTSSTRLVHALENEVLVIILELFSDLSPDLHESWLDLIICIN